MRTLTYINIVLAIANIASSIYEHNFSALTGWFVAGLWQINYLIRDHE